MDPIQDLDLWFRHAESIGQTRLNNFLVTGSVLLAACAGVLNLSKFPIIGAALSIALALFGMVLSLLWAYLGVRQQKFHGYLQLQLDRALDRLPADQKINYAIYHVRSLQRRIPIADVSNDFMLSEREQLYSSRFFLAFVPRLFILAYLFFIVAGAIVIFKTLHMVA